MFDEILLFIFFIIMGIVLFLIVYGDKRKTKLDFKNVNEESFQKYAKFYGSIIPSDDRFNDKLKSIFDLIRNGEYDIKKIAKESDCTLEECVLKIKYLKNKRLIEDFYIDTNNLKLIVCNEEDQKLLDKYKPYIYNSHLQIDEIANVITNKGYKDIKKLRDEVFNELVYLDKKGLINGIKIDEIDKKIIYYTIEKRKKHEGLESVHCVNCGALVDVEISGKTRCGYCKNIVKGTKYEDDVL